MPLLPYVCNCAVPRCLAWKRRIHPGGVSAFNFPVKDPERCKKWIRAIKNPKFNENTALAELRLMKVCSLHFKPEEFERAEMMMKHRLMGGSGRDRRGGKLPAVLSTTAVPSIELDEAESAEPPPTKRSRTQASLPEVDSMNITEVSSTSLEPEINVVVSATKDASSPHVPRTFTAAHETYEANILSLFMRCQICGCPIYSTDVRYVRGKMRVKWDCFGGHAGTWKSMLRVKSMLKVENPDSPEDLSDEDVMVPMDSSDSNWDPLENGTDSMFTDSDSGCHWCWLEGSPYLRAAVED